ncbi:hypothetical protein HY643_02355 [Candidatus Woesearchaeota archaeon]|nr:hypothetical protein [Candidatus Woesearchaeota archaeon]
MEEGRLQKLVRLAKENNCKNVEIHFGKDLLQGRSYIQYKSGSDLLMEEKSEADTYELLQRAQCAGRVLKQARIDSEIFLGKEFSLKKHKDMLAKIYAEHVLKEKDD